MIYSHIISETGVDQMAAERDYHGMDLRIRRTAAGLTGTDMARLGGVKQPNYSGMENGKRRVPPGLVRDTLMRVEQAVAQLTTEHITEASGADDGVIILMTYSTPDALAAALPEYSWLPVTAHHQAVGRAAAALEAAGNSVRIVLQGEEGPGPLRTEVRRTNRE
jgi:transcriptional regulator with XRE-family HTH domain